MSAIKFKGYEKVNTLEELIPHFTFPFEETDGSLPVEGTETEEFSPIFRNKYLKGEEPKSVLNPSLDTFYKIFEESVKIHGKNNSIGYRERLSNNEFKNAYSWESYSELAEKRTFAGSAFIHLINQYAPDRSDDFILTLFAANKPEWIISDLASHAYSIPNTPLYDTLGKESSEYILNLTESPIMVLSKSKISKIFEINSKHLKILISIEDLTKEDDELIDQAKVQGIHLIDFKELLKIGKENEIPHRPPTADTLYTISFTSGTTGIPKGVELNHSHIVAGVLFLFVHVKIPVNPVSLVFLPLAHVYERFKIAYELSEGGAIGFPHNPENPRSFLTDIKILRPTHISSVPRLYNRIESGLKDKIKNTPGFKGWLLRNAVEYKLSTSIEDEENPSYLTKIVNSLIINKIKGQLGFDRLDFLITGGSPLSEESIVYLRKVLNCGFYQGYGSSETFGGIAITTRIAKDGSRTGAIGVSSEFKLRNLPDLNYTYESNRSGELLLRGPQIFHKYFKNEEATLSVVSSDGWFSTGDIAEIDSVGRISIIDRVKNFFKLSQGEYIASEKIENFYLSNNSFISQIFVYGNSFQSYLVGIVGIEEQLLFEYCKKRYEVSTMEQLLQDLNELEFRKFILKELNKNIEHTGLFSFEKLKNIHIKIEPFKISDDTITPTLKLKRNKAQKFYQAEIDEMYKEGLL